MIETKHTKMKELPASERPYEKALKMGVGVLSDAELLAVLLRTGTKEMTSIGLAVEVLKCSPVYEGLNALFHTTYEELKSIHGIGKVKAIELLCIAELAKRMARCGFSDRVVLDRPSVIAEYFMEEMRNFETEHFYAVFLDATSGLLKYEEIFRGCVTNSMAQPREVLRMALRCDASQIVVLHNHPSGDPTPSPEDIYATKCLMEAGDCVGIPIVDHIIIGDNSFMSMNNLGIVQELKKGYDSWQERL